LLSVVIVGSVLRRLIAREEKVLIERYGEEYEQYREASDAMIPNLW